MKKVLIVQTNINKYENLNKATGVWLGETLHFYNELKNNNISVDFASINGGIIYIDPLSLQDEYMNETDWATYTNCNIMSQIIFTKKISDLNPDEYSAIYFSGGHGAVYDFYNSIDINILIQKVYLNGGYICAVCHGVAALINAKINDKYLINDKNITGFSNNEETQIGLNVYLPYSLEDQLKNHGAKYMYGNNWSPFIQSDSKIITGQNPASARLVAIELIKNLNQY